MARMQISIISSNETTSAKPLPESRDARRRCRMFHTMGFDTPFNRTVPMIFASFSAGGGLRSAHMRCPYCQIALTASAPECPSCRLTYPRTSALVGALPRLAPMVADTTRSLGLKDQAKLRHRIEEIQRRFPQLTLQVVIHQFPPEHPFSMHVFWLFNAASFAGEGNRGKDNHALLLAIDPARGEAAIIPGYGLEPFLSHAAVDHLLELAGPAWETGRWADGILHVLDGLDQWLETIALPEEETVMAEGEF
jgi:hypothetical protein